MKLADMKNDLIAAAAEIRQLRHINEVLAAKVSGFELAGRLLNAKPENEVRGYAEDSAWKLDKQIAHIEAEMQRQPPPGTVKTEDD